MQCIASRAMIKRMTKHYQEIGWRAIIQLLTLVRLVNDGAALLVLAFQTLRKVSKPSDSCAAVSASSHSKNTKHRGSVHTVATDGSTQ
eukprot:683962-Amphidinium_carterae.1